MSIRAGCVTLAAVAALLGSARGQTLPNAAKVDTAPLDLTEPDRYEIPAILEPVRRVTLVAPTDGVVRSLDAPVGATVREGQEVAQLDRSEAAARLKIAQAELKEAAAAHDAEKSRQPGGAAPAPAGKALESMLLARIDAAQARVDLAQIAVDRCALRAPFAGKVLSSPVSAGQFVAKGTVLAELADVSSLKVLVPIRRTGAAVGGAVTLTVEGQAGEGKVQSLLPLTDAQSVLRELASPFAAAWVILPNPSGALEPGERALSRDVPVTPVVTIPPSVARTEAKSKATTSAPEPGAAATVQVIRNEYVTDVPVKVVGTLGPDRLQVTGPFRATDALIVASSVPLLHGTLIRFQAGTTGTVEPTSPNPNASGATAELRPPHTASRSGPAPIGSPGSAAPKGKAASATKATSPPAAKSGSPPF